MSYLCKEPKHNIGLSGPAHVAELISSDANPRRVFEILKMELDQFVSLVELLKERGVIQDSRWVSAEVNVCIFVHIDTKHASSHDAQERFLALRDQNALLPGDARRRMRIGGRAIVYPSLAIPHQISDNFKLYPYFLTALVHSMYACPMRTAC